MTTDQEGRWKIEGLTKLYSAGSIGAMHPTRGGNTPFLSGANFQLKDPHLKETGEDEFDIQLPPGRLFTGRVTDPQGNPVAGAQVVVGSASASNALKGLTTDADGRYALRVAEKMILPISFWAKGFAPQTASLDYGAPSEVVDIRLAAPTPLRGTVVDADGKPIANASVYVSTWRGLRYPVQRMKTDAEGRFVWEDAPADEIVIDVTARGYASQRNVSLFAGSPSRVALLKTATFTGTVIDARTKQPIEKFLVQKGSKDQDDAKARFYAGEIAKVQADRIDPGEFVLTISEPDHNVVYGVSADGYQRCESPIASLDKGDQSFTFELVKADEVSGVIIDAKGNPLRDVLVTFVTPGIHAVVENGVLTAGYSHHFPTKTTNERGEFSFPPAGEKFRLLAISDDGCAFITAKQFAESQRKIVVEPWATIKGIVRSGALPAASIPVQASFHSVEIEPNTREPVLGLEFRNQITTAADGTFSFPRVVPGLYLVGKIKLIAYSSGMSSTSVNQSVQVKAEAGKTSEVTIGGGGRTVMGSLRLAEGVDPSVKGAAHSIRLSSHFELPDPPKPSKSWQSMTEGEKQAYRNTPEMEERSRRIDEANKNSIYLTAAVNPDNTFRFEDVPAGDYMLQADYKTPSARFPNGESIGYVSQVVQISEGDLDVPVQLEPATFKLQSTLRIGATAPSFELPTLEEGKSIKLEGFKGKLVLVDFWATWCEPCKADLPALKRVFERFGKDERFVMIGLSLDESREPLGKFVEQEQLGWTQGLLGSWDTTNIPESYGVRGIPAVFLIGPDVKLISRQLSGDSIEQAVSDALSRMPK